MAKVTDKLFMFQNIFYRYSIGTCIIYTNGFILTVKYGVP